MFILSPLLVSLSCLCFGDWCSGGLCMLCYTIIIKLIVGVHCFGLLGVCVIRLMLLC